MFACTVYALYDVCFIIVSVGFKSSVELVFIYVYHAQTLNKAFVFVFVSQIRINLIKNHILILLPFSHMSLREGSRRVAGAN